MKMTAVNASKHLGIPVDIIRNWDKKGLIKSSRDSHNYIIFNIDELKFLKEKIYSGKIVNKYKILRNPGKTKFNVIELFAGAGGTALGFENAGLNHILLNEINTDCVKTLNSNFSNENIIPGDIKNINFKSYKDKVDIVQAGFPCQAFSYAGNRLGFEEARGTLFFEFARCIKETKPKIAVGENVRGLLNHENGKTLSTMLGIFDKLGYKVVYKILRSQYLDVPQKRERLIMLAIRKDLNIPFIFPKEKDYFISLREALMDCPVSEGQVYPKKKYDIMKLIPEGGYWRDLPVKLQKEYMGACFYHTGGRTGMARRLSWDEPSLTLTCAPAQKQTERCHPSETRPLNIREYARIQTFPDSWEFFGSISSQYRQIGNAVPVNFSYHIGSCLIAMLTGKIDNKNMEIIENQ